MTRNSLVGLGGRDRAILSGGLLGLGTRPSGRTPQTAAMTVAWYTVGGLIAGAVYRCLHNESPG